MFSTAEVARKWLRWGTRAVTVGVLIWLVWFHTGFGHLELERLPPGFGWAIPILNAAPGGVLIFLCILWIINITLDGVNTVPPGGLLGGVLLRVFRWVTRLGQLGIVGVGFLVYRFFNPSPVLLDYLCNTAWFSLRVRYTDSVHWEYFVAQYNRNYDNLVQVTGHHWPEFNRHLPNEFAAQVYLPHPDKLFETGELANQTFGEHLANIVAAKRAAGVEVLSSATAAVAGEPGWSTTTVVVVVLAGLALLTTAVVVYFWVTSSKTPPPSPDGGSTPTSEGSPLQTSTLGDYKAWKARVLELASDEEYETPEADKSSVSSGGSVDSILVEYFGLQGSQNSGTSTPEEVIFGPSDEEPDSPTPEEVNMMENFHFKLLSEDTPSDSDRDITPSLPVVDVEGKAQDSLNKSSAPQSEVDDEPTPRVDITSDDYFYTEYAKSFKFDNKPYKWSTPSLKDQLQQTPNPNRSSSIPPFRVRLPTSNPEPYRWPLPGDVLTPDQLQELLSRPRNSESTGSRTIINPTSSTRGPSSAASAEMEEFLDKLFEKTQPPRKP